MPTRPLRSPAAVRKHGVPETLGYLPLSAPGRALLFHQLCASEPINEMIKFILARHAEQSTGNRPCAAPPVGHTTNNFWVLLVDPGGLELPSLTTTAQKRLALFQGKLSSGEWPGPGGG